MKSALRKDVAMCRKQLSRQEAAAKSRCIQKRLCQLADFTENHCILFYAAYQKEVRTQEAIQTALQQGKKVVLPLIDLQDKKLILFQVYHYPQDVEEGCFSIPQPRKERQRVVPLECIDLVILPGIAFDLQGNRLGYGGGYYDRLLSAKHSATTLIGLAYELQIVEDIPNLSHDVQADKVITEKRVITCQVKQSSVNSH